MTLRNLGVLAALRQNDKLLTEGEFFTIYTPTTLRALYRAVYRESREQNMLRVTSCLRNARTFVASVVSEYAPSEDIGTEGISVRLHRQTQIQLCTRVLNALTESLQGLDNLCETYNDDAAMLVKIRQLKHEVVDFLESSRQIATQSAVMQNVLTTVETRIPETRVPSPLSSDARADAIAPFS